MKFPYRNIVVLTGAGISAESGIRTFRDQDGLWENHRIEDVATPEGYHRDPGLVQSFYNQRRQQLESGTVFPNAAHKALARLEKELDGKVTVVTQNIDNLHEEAGSKNVIHMHGELLKAQCSRTGQTIEWSGDLSQDDHCHCCQLPSPLRPNVVWFGEMPIGMDRIHQALMEADLFISIGTSGAVYPAAGFVHEAALHGAHTVELNLEPSEVESEFTEKRYGPASVIVPEYIHEILEG
ncbi:MULTISPECIES: Sir2 family NAD+-dependent deacetylase [Photobacterium]|uniref:NAD-dependent protein deacylase n=1 Tax=Photobacterium ganghwense TaxID=320778 RepID=A0A0J1HCU2_9GAMM|nr:MULTISPECIES: Sir2 family NAD+-dependent deacetylase [Photobacterium]KLV09463.1 NAD-dependent deacetylase [Photobacterium ganghwense]MBV1839388.1 NAD-dependent protein deacylase [Photobacterium ganghwense]PSU08624.1 NAD-dependent protein deacylase [Photobacterium ganghwense]QSV15429.1 NAD-dependent protein deacylase [Photobacterium ganghwense]